MFFENMKWSGWTNWQLFWLTQVTGLTGKAEGTFPENPSNEQSHMAYQNKGWGQGGACVILIDQAVALETPVLISVFLYNLICVAGKRRKLHKNNI